MQIPGNPLLAGLGFLRQPQAGGKQQINPDLQAKANAKVPAPKITPQAQADSLSRAENLAQAVQVLSDQGRLPPRGSLIDLSA
jgi:hypothetical protein